MPEQPCRGGFPRHGPFEHETLTTDGLKEVPHVVDGPARGGERQPGPDSEVLCGRGPVPPEVPQREVVVHTVRHPVPDEDVGGFVPPLRPSADHPFERGEREEVGSGLPAERKVEPLLDLAARERFGEDAVELFHATLTGGVVQPKLPPPRPLPIPKVRPDFPENPPQIASGNHVEGPAHGPGPHHPPTTDGVVDVLVGEPAGPHPHSKPVGPHVLPLERDNPRHSVNNARGPIAPDPVGVSTTGPPIRHPTAPAARATSIT